ncbi:Uncharacterised protein [Mycobacteroides abscessus]|nr:Uncharacterised protein [Mycobacteroides abscessus]
MTHTSNYIGLPQGDGWMDNIPSQYVHGEHGFDERIMRDLAEVGVRAYTLDDLANGPATIPEAIPVFVDWLLIWRNVYLDPNQITGIAQLFVPD